MSDPEDDDSKKIRLALARGSTRSIAPRSVELPPLPTAPRRRPGRVFGGIADAAPAVYGAAFVLAMSCLVAIGYLAPGALSDDPTSPGPSVKSGALQKFATAPGRSPSAPPLDPLQADEVIASLIDRLETTIAQGSLGAGPEDQVATLCNRILELMTSASHDGFKMVITMLDRFAATATAAAAAGRFEEARRLEQYSHLQCNSAPTAAAGFAGTNPNGAPFQQGETALAQALHPTAAGQPGAAGENDQPISFPQLAAPAAPDAVPDQPVDVTQRAQLAMVPDGAAAPVAADLPAFAPIRVVLTFARDDAARVERMAAIRQVLRTAEVEVADRVGVDAQHPRPGIGYYFQSDRDAAVGVSRRLEPLLGAVEPVVLQLRGRVPSPGTIEIAVP
jgi:hypothetical protein